MSRVFGRGAAGASRPFEGESGTCRYVVRHAQPSSRSETTSCVFCELGMERFPAVSAAPQFPSGATQSRVRLGHRWPPRNRARVPMSARRNPRSSPPSTTPHPTRHRSSPSPRRSGTPVLRRRRSLRAFRHARPLHRLSRRDLGSHRRKQKQLPRRSRHPRRAGSHRPSPRRPLLGRPLPPFHRAHRRVTLGRLLLRRVPTPLRSPHRSTRPRTGSSSNRMRLTSRRILRLPHRPRLNPC